MVEARVDVGSAGGRPRFRLLDLLRLVAALSVVLYHYTARDSSAWSGSLPLELWAPLSGVTVYGFLGVELFFLISGFVVLMSAWSSDLPGFVASRVGRLYPAYWFAVLLTGSLLFFDRSIDVGGSWASVGPSGILVNLTMFQTAFGVPHVDGVYWTLWAELKFYIIVGLLVLVRVTRARIIVLATAWPILAAFVSQFQLPALSEILMPDYAPFFAAGMLLFLAYREGWSIATILPLALNWIAIVRGVYVEQAAPGPHLPTNPNVVVLVYATFVIAIALVTQTQLSAVRWRWLTAAGALTYPLYLIHEIAGWWLIGKLYPALPKTLVLLLVIVIMLVVAYMVNRIIEQPIGRRLRRVLEASLRRPSPGDVLAEGSSRKRAADASPPSDSRAPDADAAARVRAVD
ncbi:acyltransferase family protein [Naasia lichenicola]|nr:acyltransferase [Naasia lichenicola]